jgi:tetratricopeptide (TPR) repeat protein
MATIKLVLFAFSLAILTGLYVQPGSAQQAAATAQEHAVRANEALKSGHPEKAIPEFQALIALEPDNVDAQANLGVLLYFRGDLKAAVIPLRIAVKLNPDLPKIRALLGLTEAGLGQTDTAAVDLKLALNGLAGADEAKLRKEVALKLVEIDTGREDLPGAAAALESVHDITSDDQEMLFASYRVYSDLAAESLLNLSLTAPKSGRMQQAIAHELERVRDYPGAIASYRRAIALEPHLPGIHSELAEVLRASDNQADKAAAQGEYELALKENTSDALAATRLGDILADKGDLDRATRYYEQALKAQPEEADALIGLAHVESDRGADDKALALLQKVVSDDPSNMLAHFRLSALYRKMRRPEDAKRELAEYQKLRELKDKLREVYSTMKLQAPGAADEGTSGHIAPDAKRGTP